MSFLALRVAAAIFFLIAQSGHTGDVEQNSLTITLTSICSKFKVVFVDLRLVLRHFSWHWRFFTKTMSGPQRAARPPGKQNITVIMPYVRCYFIS